MSVAKRIANIVRANIGVQKIKYPGAKILSELHRHESDLEAKLDALEFAEYLLDFEIQRWDKLLGVAENKQAAAKEKQKILAERLVALANATKEKYSERKAAMDGTVEELRDTLSRVKTTILTIETDQDLRALSRMLSLENMGDTSFDIHTEGRKIRSLLHTADALLELGS